MGTYHASDALAEVDILSVKDRLAYDAAGLETVGDVLNRFPKRYEDRRSFDAFPVQAGGAACCLRGLVVDARMRGLGTRFSYFEAIIEDSRGGGILESSQVTCRWFNMPWMKNMLAAGHEVILYGTVKEPEKRSEGVSGAYDHGSS